RDENAIPMLQQDLTQRRYFGKEVPENGCVNWSRPAREVVSLARACDYYPFPSPWGSPRARLGDTEIGVIKARLTGELCDAGAGRVRGRAGPGVQVGGADEWVGGENTLIEGKYLPAADSLQSGARLGNGAGAAGGGERNSR